MQDVSRCLCHVGSSFFNLSVAYLCQDDLQGVALLLLSLTFLPSRVTCLLNCLFVCVCLCSGAVQRHQEGQNPQEQRQARSHGLSDHHHVAGPSPLCLCSSLSVPLFLLVLSAVCLCVPSLLCCVSLSVPLCSSLLSDLTTRTTGARRAPGCLRAIACRPVPRDGSRPSATVAKGETDWDTDGRTRHHATHPSHP
jgi:hypothetical protein